MENTCQNCSYVITDNFCGNCGQKKFKRIDKKYLVDEVQYSLLHTNKGFFYSIKNIIKNPGKTAKDFIDGNRVNHYKPILLAFVLSGISAFISLKIIGMSAIMEQVYANQKVNTAFMHNYMSVVNSYNSFIMLLSIPLVSILTYLLFRSWKNNYYEHIIMNAYIQCCYTIFCILILYPVLYFLKDSGEAFTTVTMFSMLFLPIIMLWFYKEFYPEKSFGKILLRVFLFLIILMILFVIAIFLTVILYVAIHGPEGLKDFAPKK